MPTADNAWLEDFSKGLTDVALLYDCRLVGGDTVRGPLVITIQGHGIVNSRQAIKRGDANIGDLILMTGPIGSAAALKVRENNFSMSSVAQQYLEKCFYQPQPQIEIGKLLNGVATSTIDISDGLISDLGHICKASNVGVRVNLDKIPISPHITNELSHYDYLEWALYGGDDYHLCVTVPEDFIKIIGQNFMEKYDVSFIGEITTGSDIEVYKGKEIVKSKPKGFIHF